VRKWIAVLVAGVVAACSDASPEVLEYQAFKSNGPVSTTVEMAVEVTEDSAVVTMTWEAVRTHPQSKGVTYTWTMGEMSGETTGLQASIRLARLEKQQIIEGSLRSDDGRWSGEYQANPVVIEALEGAVTGPVVASIQVVPESVELLAGDSVQIVAVAMDEHGTPVAADMEWASSDTAVATVEAGLVKALTEGTATVTATADGVSGQTAVTVKAPVVISPPTVASVEVIPDAVELLVGDSVQVVAAVLDEQGNPVDADITWTSSDAAVATVDAGKITGQGEGSALVSATVDGITGSTAVTVTAPVILPPPTQGPSDIGLTLHRLDGGSGPVLISNGIMLVPGQLFDAGVSGVAVEVNGAEVRAYVEALKGRHKDGSIVSLLVQFTADPATQSQAVLRLQGSPQQTRLSKAPVDFRVNAPSDVRDRGFPAAVAMPGIEHTVAAAQIFGPTISVDATHSLGGAFTAFEDDFVYWSNRMWGMYDANGVIGVNYYDRGFHHMVWSLRSGNPEYLRRGAAYTFNHRYAYYEPANYNITQERMWFPDGMAAHYWLTGDEESHYGVRGLARRVDHPSSWNWTNMFKCSYQGEARPVARGLHTLGWTYRLGHTDRDFYALTTGFLDLVLQGGSRQELLNTNPNDYRHGAWVFTHPDYPVGNGCSVEYVSNFMNAMIADALILTYDHVVADPRIPGMVKGLLDYLRTSQWRGPEGNNLQTTKGEPSPSFNYYDVELSGSGGVGPTVDLNGFYVNIFAWYGHRFGGAEYTHIANEVFKTLSKTPKDGVHAPWVQSHKQFNETYQRAWQYPALR
jgi:hypothetical protein